MLSVPAFLGVAEGVPDGRGLTDGLRVSSLRAFQPSGLAEWLCHRSVPRWVSPKRRA